MTPVVYRRRQWPSVGLMALLFSLAGCTMIMFRAAAFRHYVPFLPLGTVLLIMLATYLDPVFLVVDGVLIMTGFRPAAIPLATAHLEVSGSVVTLRWMSKKGRCRRIRATPELRAFLTEHYAQAHAGASGLPGQIWIGRAGWFMSVGFYGLFWMWGALFLAAKLRMLPLIYLTAVPPLFLLKAGTLSVLNHKGLWIMPPTEEPQLIPTAEIERATRGFRNRGGPQEVAVWRRGDPKPIRLTNYAELNSISGNPLWRPLLKKD